MSLLTAPNQWWR